MKHLSFLKHFTVWTCLLAFLMTVQSFAQGIGIQGQITGPTGQALEGVTVTVKGANIGAISDAEGRYQLNVRDGNDILVFTYYGFTQQEIIVGDQRQVDVQMTQDVQSLDEVVITGYGSQEYANVTGSISKVKGGDLANIPVSGATQALQGRAPGVQVVRNGGAPGNSGSIRIRGTGTVNNADPLLVIDGVPVGIGSSLNDINPNDIESIEVLKDASAAAIYGNRGANGVVIVTTKRGVPNQPLRLNASMFYGVNSPVNQIEVLDAPTLAELRREAYTNDGDPIAPVWRSDTLTAFKQQRTNWQDELLRTGVTQNYDFSLSGGSTNSNYYFSGAYYREDGMIQNSFFDRFTLRLNSDHAVTDWLKVGQNLTLIRQEDKGFNTNSAQSGLLWSAIRFHPSLPVQVTANDPIPGHEVGDYGSSALAPFGSEFGDINNPIFTVDTEDARNTRNRLLGNVFLEIEILKGLKLKGNFAVDGVLSDSYDFDVIIDRQIRTRPRNNLTRSYNEGYSLLAEYLLTYQKQFGDHNIDFVGGYSAQQFYSEFFSARKRDFGNEDSTLRFFNNGSNLRSINGDAEENSLVSGFGRVNYNFKDRYLLTATFRADGNSKFSPGNKWGYFPGFSAGWRISNEPFFNDQGLISNLKIKAGWGQLGSDGGVSSLQYLALISQGRRYSFGGQEVVGANQSRIPNENISWETAELLDFGLNVGFLDNALLLDLGYFIKDTRNMLLAPPTVGTIGNASVPDQNVGEMRNQGLEAQLTYRKLVGEFTYSISANASFISNEVTKLFDGNFLASRTYGRPNQEISRTFEGQPLATFFGWRTDGLYQTVEEVNNDPNISNDPRRTAGLIQPGDVRFVDLNGDGIIDDEDREILGSPHPVATYGLNANAQWKGFDLTLFFLGAAGVDIFNADRMQGIDPTYPFNMYAEVENRWNGQGTSNEIPRMTNNRDNLNHRASDLFIESGDFFRLKNLTLGYTLPTTLTQKIKIRNVRVYATGQNVFTITNYSGIDPELGYVDGNLQINVDYAQYPQARTFIFGVNLGF
jgi:TonB-linked SusC/RagA family outer membrane protein